MEKGIINCDICEGEGASFTPDLLEKGDTVEILSRRPSADFVEGEAVKVRRISDGRETEINPSMVSPA